MIHHFCHRCHQHIRKEAEKTPTLICENCDEIVNLKKNRQEGNFFLYLNIADQLKNFIEFNHDKLIDHSIRVKHDNYAIEDIYDGQLYKKLVTDDMISINFNMDSTPIFKSSPVSILPILFTKNELSPLQRMKNVMLCSLWFGKGKPKNMNEFMKPFVTEMRQLYESGIEYEYQQIKYVKRCQLLVSICDSVAKPTVSNSTQFNGEYGCGLCLHPGIQVIEGKGTVRVYPIDQLGNPFAEGLRIHSETLIHVSHKEKGMKGRSALCDHPTFDIIDHSVPDWMHSVLLGISKQFAKLWINSIYYMKDFSCYVWIK